MTTTAFAAALALFIAAAQQPASNVASSERTTLTDALLAQDTWKMILRSEAMIAMMQKSAEAPCRERKLSSTRILEFPKDAKHKGDGTVTHGSWKEEWVVDRCGKLFAYTIQFTALPVGTQIGVEQPFNPTPVPR